MGQSERGKKQIQAEIRKHKNYISKALTNLDF